MNTKITMGDLICSQGQKQKYIRSTKTEAKDLQEGLVRCNKYGTTISSRFKAKPQKLPDIRFEVRLELKMSKECTISCDI